MSGFILITNKFCYVVVHDILGFHKKIHARQDDKKVMVEKDY